LINSANRFSIPIAAGNGLRIGSGGGSVMSFGRRSGARGW
jgi:hypothetical protein